MTDKLEPSEWKNFFDRVSRELAAREVEIEVAGLDLGDEVDAEWVPFSGVTYDPKDEVISIFSDRLEHRIPKPNHVYVDYGVDGLHSMEVEDADGHKQIVVLRNNLVLPAPA